MSGRSISPHHRGGKTKELGSEVSVNRIVARTLALRERDRLDCDRYHGCLIDALRDNKKSVCESCSVFDLSALC